ncbi:hypothetical protein [Neptuniibacter sp. QD37_11]|uniref:hypothetical protein n=1 Tax=Neptuniibacter sp. QD37_11 TaxID=3398209 RepID=UPI0039F4CA35
MSDVTVQLQFFKEITKSLANHDALNRWFYIRNLQEDEIDGLQDQLPQLIDVIRDKPCLFVVLNSHYLLGTEQFFYFFSPDLPILTMSTDLDEDGEYIEKLDGTMSLGGFQDYIKALPTRNYTPGLTAFGLDDNNLSDIYTPFIRTAEEVSELQRIKNATGNHAETSIKRYLLAKQKYLDFGVESVRLSHVGPLSNLFDFETSVAVIELIETYYCSGEINDHDGLFPPTVSSIIIAFEDVLDGVTTTSIKFVEDNLTLIKVGESSTFTPATFDLNDQDITLSQECESGVNGAFKSLCAASKAITELKEQLKTAGQELNVNEALIRAIFESRTCPNPERLCEVYGKCLPHLKAEGLDQYSLEQLEDALPNLSNSERELLNKDSHNLINDETDVLVLPKESTSGCTVVYSAELDAFILKTDDEHLPSSDVSGSIGLEFISGGRTKEMIDKLLASNYA